MKNKNEEVQKFINELNESRNYVKNLEIPKVMNQINSYTKNNITEHDLEIVQLNNPEKNEKRISEINKISTELNENQLENEEYLEKVILVQI